MNNIALQRLELFDKLEIELKNAHVKDEDAYHLKTKMKLKC